MEARVMIALTVVLGIVAHALFFWVVPKLAAAKGVHDRYFERSLGYAGTCPGTEQQRRDAAKAEPPCLQAFVEFRPEEARNYAFPVLFPYDLIMMVFLAGFLAVGSVTFGAQVPLVAGKTLLLVAMPILYFVADLAEDGVLAWLLTHHGAVSDSRVITLKCLTVAKFFTLGVAYLECGILAVSAGYVRFTEV
jgi:hypothetical protein